MRWVPILLALSAGTVVHAQPADDANPGPADTAGTTEPAETTEPTEAAELSAEAADSAEAQRAALEKDAAFKEWVAKDLAKIASEPTDYTNDRVLGGSPRVVGNDQPGMIAFTFDDGPVPQYTPIVLDALAKYDIPATFFLVSKHFKPKLERTTYQEAHALLERELAAGHTIGSHTARHKKLLTATPKDLDREMNGALEDLSKAAKQPIALFRAPFGKLNQIGRRRLKKLGVTEVFWSIDPQDWRAQPGDEADLRRKINREIQINGGGVILLHDTKPVTASIIAKVFDDLEASNCRKLASHKTPIIPVSIHYFLHDGDRPRAIPDAVKKRTEAYKAALPDRCAKRAEASRPRLAKATKSVHKPTVDLGHDTSETKTSSTKLRKDCGDTPRAKGCT